MANMAKWSTPSQGGGGGEANTASNVGAGGVGLFKQKAAFDLEFRNVNVASAKLTVALDAGNNEVDLDLGANASVRSFGISIDGAGAVISTGVKGYIEIPYACTITGWTILADQSGSVVVDVWKDTYANYPPTVADTIAGSELPTITTATKGQDLSLSTWTTSVTAGDILGFNVNSATTVTRVHLIIRANIT